MDRFTTSLIERTKEYIAGFIGDHFTENICYHNIDHTLGVVEACEIIGKNANLLEDELETVIVAAWFHDSGYYLGCKDHEKESVRIAKTFLRNENKSEAYIKVIGNCILSTKIPQNPRTKLEQIICDADLFHLSSDHFFTKSALLLREINIEKQAFTSLSWMVSSRDFMESHRYHTPYGQTVLYPKLQRNLTLLKSRIAATKQ